MSKKIIIRADASFDIGVGHIMRDLVLANQYLDAQIVFAVQDLKGNINKTIERNGYGIYLLSSNEPDELVEYINENHFDRLIIDHYGIDYNYEHYIKKATNIEILSLDDTYEKHCCDILLNHNIYAQESRYRGLVPKESLLRCGVNYTLLRDEFLHVTTKRRDIHNKKRVKIFVAMGGADSKNMNIAVLEELKDLSVDIVIVTTKANENLAQLEAYIKEYDQIHLHVNSDNLARIIESCDIAIVTPSVIVNEIVFLKIPFISIMVTDNQRQMYEYLCAKGLFCLTHSELSQLNLHVKELCDATTYSHQIETICNIIEKRVKQ